MFPPHRGPRRALLLTFPLWAHLTACDDAATADAADAVVSDVGVGADVGADVGTEEADGGPPGDLRCDTVALESEGLRLLRCDDGVHHELSFFGAPLCVGLTAQIVINGDAFGPQSYPQILWRPIDARTVEGRFSGLRGRPVLMWRLSISGEGVTTSLEAVFEDDARSTLDHISSLSFAPWGGCGPAEGWRAWGALGEPPTPWAEAPPRADGQCLWSPQVALCLAADPPAPGDPSPRSRVSLTAGGGERALPTISPLGPPRSLSGVLSASSPIWWLGVSETPAEVGDHLAERWAVPPTAEAPPRRWGWGNAGAYGALMSTGVLMAERRALQGMVSGSVEQGGLSVALQGMWYAGLGLWTPGEAFGTRWPGLDADLTVRWPLLSMADEAELLAERPEWRLLGEDGVPTPCGLEPDLCGVIDPRLPAVREFLSRAALELPERVSEVALTGLAPMLRVDPQGIADLAQALSVRPDLHLSLPLTQAWPILGERRSLRLLDTLSAPLGEACEAADQDRAGPRSEACAQQLRELSTDDAAHPEGDLSSQPARLAHALQQSWPLGVAGHPLDPGAIFVGDVLEASVARQWAAVALVAGGPWRLGDSPTALAPARQRIFAAPLEAGLIGLGAGRPLPEPDGTLSGANPPTLWRLSGRWVVAFNWGPEPVTVAVGRWADWAGPTGTLYTDEIWASPGDVEDLVVPPHDVVVLRPLVE